MDQKIGGEANEPEIKAVKWPLLSLGQDRIEQQTEHIKWPRMGWSAKLYFPLCRSPSGRPQKANFIAITGKATAA